MKISFWMILILGFVACRENELERLQGHWHIKPLSPKDYDHMFYHTMDIYPDTTGFYDRGYRGSDGIAGWVTLAENRIDFGGECWSLSVEYFDKGDSLLLSEIHFDDKESEKYIAKKVDATLCDKQLEFFNSTIYSIDIPITKQKDSLVFVYERSLLQTIIFGQDRQSPFDFTMYLGDRKSSVDDIPLWREKHFIKVPENRWEKIRVAIVSSGEVPMSIILPTLKLYREFGEEIIYLACREGNREKFQLRYKPVFLQPLDFEEYEKLNYKEFVNVLE